MRRRASWPAAFVLSVLAGLAAVPLVLALAWWTLCLVVFGVLAPLRLLGWFPRRADVVPSGFRVVGRVADVYRGLAARVLGRPVEAPETPVTGADAWTRARQCLGDERRWREPAWCLVFAGAVWLLPFGAVMGWAIGVVVWAGPPVAGSLWPGMPVLLLCWCLWAVLVVPLTRAWAALAAAMLGDDGRSLRRALAQERALRAEQLDHSAAELARIERDLHDGAQARIAALGMTLGLAATLIERDPAGARALVEEAAGSSTQALAEIRAVVHGIRPPVLADRGLVGAVQALAVDLPVPVAVHAEGEPSLPGPVEATLYFTAAELLANAVKHARCRGIDVTISHEDSLARVVVRDDGVGGAGLTDGGGLSGLRRRIAAHGGTLVVQSPAGGPTEIRAELPCASSSARTTPSSGRA